MRTLLAILASYRIAYLISTEDGPFDLATKLRGFVYARFGEDSWQFRGIDCPLCVSFWVALAMQWMPRRIQSWLGVAGGVLVVHRALEAMADMGFDRRIEELLAEMEDEEAEE